MINGKQPLITLSVKLNLADAKRLNILNDMSEDEFRNRVYNLLTFIYPNIMVVDLGTAAAHITSFTCAPQNSAEIEAVLTAYEKEISAEIQEKNRKAVILVEKARGYFRANLLQVLPLDETDETIENILPGMKFQVENINFMTNTVTFKLVE